MSGGGLALVGLAAIAAAAVDTRAVEGTMVRSGVRSGCDERLWGPSML